MAEARLQVIAGGAVPQGPLTTDPWQFRTMCVDAFVASWRACGFSPVTIDDDIGLLERTLTALGRPAWEVTPEDIDRVVGDLAVKGRATSTRREYVQIFKGFHRFLRARKGAEIEAALGIRLGCPVDEFNASRHVGDDSPALLPSPTPERVNEFFSFTKQGIATARKYGPAARDYAMFRTLYHAGLRSEEASLLEKRTCTSPAARSASSTPASAREPTRPGHGLGGCPCSTAWTWSCGGSWRMCGPSSQTRRCSSPTSPAAACIAGPSVTGSALSWNSKDVRHPSGSARLCVELARRTTANVESISSRSSRCSVTEPSARPCGMSGPPRPSSRTPINARSPALWPS